MTDDSSTVQVQVCVYVCLTVLYELSESNEELATLYNNCISNYLYKYHTRVTVFPEIVASLYCTTS